jgi:hypothetical protein
MRRTIVMLAAVAGAVVCGVGPATADDSTFTASGPLAENGKLSTATCPSGSHLIGGGYSAGPVVDKQGYPHDMIDTNGPSPTQANTWGASAVKGSIAAYALCEKDRT